MTPKIWATNSGYSGNNKVFKSTNGGSTWTNLSKNLPNVPALTIVKQKDSEDKLWLGNDIGVYYIDNNMTDWVAYNTSLPNVIITESAHPSLDAELVRVTKLIPKDIALIKTNGKAASNIELSANFILQGDERKVLESEKRESDVVVVGYRKSVEGK